MRGAGAGLSGYALSDAFRNRTITLQCEPLDAGLSPRPSAAAADAAAARADAYEALELLCRRCGCAPALARELVKLHEMALAHAASTPRKVRAAAPRTCGRILPPFLVGLR